ncbi:MAG: LytTR family transcriptional regulator DNA-binding domain-containing protein [Rhodothermales bacterium]
MRVLLVDDERLARERFRTLLDRSRFSYEIVGEAESGKKAIPLIYETRPDLVFLDIQMPGLDGFEVLDLLAPPRPHVVFVTAYDEYALRAFDVHALDYLTKPVKLDRLERSLDRIQALLAQQQSDAALDRFAATRAEEPLRRLTLHAGRRLRVTEPADIRFIEAREKLVFATLFDGATYTADLTLQALADRLDSEQFLRVHRAYLVNVAAIRELIPWFSGTYQIRLDDDTKVPVARRRVRAVKELLGG